MVGRKGLVIIWYLAKHMFHAIQIDAFMTFEKIASLTVIALKVILNLWLFLLHLTNSINRRYHMCTFFPQETK
jgi:hypothetical protein